METHEARARKGGKGLSQKEVRTRKHIKLNDPVLVKMNPGVSVSEETGVLLPRRGGAMRESFHDLYVLHRLPVYRAPFFPVFLYTGNIEYRGETSRFCKDEPHRSDTSPTDVELRRLAEALHNIGDKLPEDGDLQLMIEAQMVEPQPLPLLTCFSYLVMDPYSAIPLARHLLSRLLRWLNIFKRKHKRDHNASGRKLIFKQNPAEYPKREGSHLVPAAGIIRSRRVSSCHSNVLVEVEAAVTAVSSSVTNTEPLLQTSSDPGRSQRVSSCLSRSHSVPSLSPSTSAENKTSTRSESLPDMLLKSSFEEFTPEVTVEEDDETYWFQCSCPGLYQCSVTGLVFHMEGEGDVVYRVVPWDRRLLAQHHKRPAGPLFDIKCLQQSVCRLHLPHCEISSTAGCHFLSVAHVKDDGIEFLAPHKTTETHVVINITGFSGFGNVKDEDSPPEPVRALVLLFYRPPSDPDLESVLNVLMLPRNVVLRDLLRTRKKLVGDEIYIETSPHCKLQPAQEYTLSTCPEDDSVLVQPTEAEFDCDDFDNYFTSFQVNLEKTLKHIKLFLRDCDKRSVWERRVCLSSTGGKRSCGPSSLNLPQNEMLLAVRSGFIDGISGPVLNSLLDKLLEIKVMSDSERESADVMQNKRDKARFVIDTVRKKGEAASSEMIEFLCEVDPFLCEHLGLS